MDEGPSLAAQQVGLPASSDCVSELPKSLCLASSPTWTSSPSAHFGLCFNVVTVRMRTSFFGITDLFNSMFAVGKDTGPRLRVCYSFKQFLWRIFFFFFKYFIICWKNCNAAHVWWLEKWYRFVTKVKKHLMDSHLMDYSNKCQICICC